jgi:hypothetical protein
VRGVLGENGGQVTFVDDEHPVGALAADGARSALRERIRPRRLRRRLEHLDALGGEHRVEGRRELAVAVAEQKPDPPRVN